MSVINLSYNKRLRLFKYSWIILILFTICDLGILNKESHPWLPINIQASSIGVILYIIIFFIIIPFNKMKLIVCEKKYFYTLLLTGLLLIEAYISSALSVLPGIAITATVSRYTLFFLVFISTIIYSKIFNEANNFLVKTFIYFNILIIISCFLDFYIPSFDYFLINHFGRMESKFSLLSINGTVYMRPQGLITDTNLTAYSISISFLLLLLNEDKFNYKRKFIFYIYYILCGIITGMLASRSAQIILIVSCILFFLFKYTNRKRIVIAFLILLSAQCLTPQTQARIYQIFNKSRVEDEINYGRPIIWKACLLGFKASPIIGIGSNVFFYESTELIAASLNEAKIEKPNKDVEKVVITDKLTPQGIFFTMLTEHGIIGLLLFIVFLCFSFLQLIKNKSKISLIFISGLLFVSSVSNYAPYYKYYLLICVLLYILIDKEMLITNQIDPLNEV